MIHCSDIAFCLQSKRIVDHAQFLAQGLFPVTTNADEVRNMYTFYIHMSMHMYMCVFTHIYRLRVLHIDLASQQQGYIMHIHHAIHEAMLVPEPGL